MPANQTLWCICRTASSFFAGKPRSYGRTGRHGESVKPRYRSSLVGARLAGEPDTTVRLSNRVIVLRGQTSLLRANRVPRCICHTALSFFAGEPRSYGRTRRSGVSVKPHHRSSRASLAPTGEPGAAMYLSHRVIVLRGQASLLRANRAPRCICHTALSFFAGEPRSYRENAFIRDQVGSKAASLLLLIWAPR